MFIYVVQIYIYIYIYHFSISKVIRQNLKSRFQCPCPYRHYTSNALKKIRQHLKSRFQCTFPYRPQGIIGPQCIPTSRLPPEGYGYPLLDTCQKPTQLIPKSFQRRESQALLHKGLDPPMTYMIIQTLLIICLIYTHISTHAKKSIHDL